MSWSGMFDTLIGGFLAILGGLIGAIYAARTVRKSRMEELIAERKITANGEAYSHVVTIQSHWAQSKPEGSRKAIHELDEWFFRSRLFLPGRFPEKWLLARKDINRFCHYLNNAGNTEAQALEAHASVVSALKDAIDEIYEDMGMSAVGGN